MPPPIPSLHHQMLNLLMSSDFFKDGWKCEFYVNKILVAISLYFYNVIEFRCKKYSLCSGFSLDSKELMNLLKCRMTKTECPILKWFPPAARKMINGKQNPMLAKILLHTFYIHYSNYDFKHNVPVIFGKWLRLRKN